MILIIDNILTPYEIARYNRINTQLKGNLEVWFHAKTEDNRHWKQYPKTEFTYRIDGGLLNTELIEVLHKRRGEITRIICCGWNHPIYWYCLLLAKRNNIRFTLWSGSTEFEKSLIRTLVQPFVKIFISQCSDFIAYGSRARQYLISLGAKPSKIDIFYNSVDVDYFHEKTLSLYSQRESLRTKYRIPNKNIVLLFVGQLIARKGISQLVHAFEKLNRRNLTLLVVGSGNLKNEVQGKSIIHIDHLEYNEIPEIYAMSDALILPSTQEVWGLVVNEAMASGLPVLVSSRAGCVPDLVKNGVNGFTLTPNEQGILFVLNRYFRLSESKRRRLGEESYKWIKYLYDQSVYKE